MFLIKMWILISILLTLLLFCIYFYSSMKYSLSPEKNSAFECGFDPMSLMRNPFSVRFFLLVLLFLVFDVEVSLILPFLSFLSFYKMPPFFLSIFLLLILILMLGLFHEWKEGTLEWF